MSLDPSIPSSEPAVADWLSLVQRKVEELSYGVITIVVHNSAVTQIESTEKVRLDPPHKAVAAAKKS